LVVLVVKLIQVNQPARSTPVDYKTRFAFTTRNPTQFRHNLLKFTITFTFAFARHVYLLIG